MGVFGAHRRSLQPRCVQGRPGISAHPQTRGGRRRLRVGSAQVHRVVVRLRQGHEGQEQEGGRDPV